MIEDAVPQRQNVDLESLIHLVQERCGKFESALRGRGCTFAEVGTGRNKELLVLLNRHADMDGGRTFGVPEGYRIVDVADNKKDKSGVSSFSVEWATENQRSQHRERFSEIIE